ncbi:MAG: DEAD/DEAH box helicase family protein [Selenomonadaceae bacterium]|nr:DEAD/DEAH box helicase family protein [Selenomonadaceae bacterium]
MLKLKQYQERTLAKLRAFLTAARLTSPQAAFADLQEAQGYAQNYRPLPELMDVPYTCLRLPTGGGKTLLGSYAIEAVADYYSEHTLPIVIWLVPTDIIRQQTLAVFRSSAQENRRVLDAAFDGQVRVYDITEFAHLRPQDLAGGVNVFIATFAAFRVKNKEGRKIYQTHEALDACFARIPDQYGFDRDEHGRSLHSFANLLAYVHPLVIVDEAHNHASKLSVEVLQRISPLAIIEFTATPAANSNVLYKVSASELKAEEMIKLPVQLEEARSWQDAIVTGIQQRNHLEEVAAAEPEYLRPIMLIQAEPKDREVTVEVVKQYLLEEAGIPEAEIAIATGEVHELADVDLLAASCPIRYIITVQALKEGWDCSFAYVFVSTASVQSSKDAEQLLGRVLRMPYARRRVHEELNRAYAHVAVASWLESVSKIKDNLIGLGFEQEEAALAVEPAEQQAIWADDALGDTTQETEATLTFHTETAPDFSQLDVLPLGMTVYEDKEQGGFTVELQAVSAETVQHIAAQQERIFAAPEDRANFTRAVIEQGYRLRPLTPSERRVPFQVMQLCLDFGEGATVADKEDFLPQGWRLTDFPATLPAFHIDPNTHVYVFDVEGEHVTESYEGVQQQTLALGRSTHWTEGTLVARLLRHLAVPDVDTADVVEYLRRVIRNQLEVERVPLADLVRLRFQLQHALQEQIQRYREQAYARGMQQVLVDAPQTARVEPDIYMVFQPDVYPTNRFYRGRVHFHKHYYPQIADMDSEEEVRCAQCIDANPHVETWVRNIARDRQHSFWLPTHTDKFYPDFVVKLIDGRVAAIEYKGEHLQSNADSEEKRLIGDFWAAKSGGRCLFLMATERDQQGRTVDEQIQEFLQ